MRLSQKHKDKLWSLFSFFKIGAFVTILSLALSFFFLKIVGTPLIPTYIALYVTTIFISFLLNAKYTFKAKKSTKRLIFYYGSYGLTMLLGVVLLRIFRTYLPFENWILAYLVIPFTMTSNFTLSSLIFKDRK